MNLIHVDSIADDIDVPTLNDTYNEREQNREQERGVYLPYNPDKFSFAYFYRPQNDVVASWIVRSGMEGIDRYEISSRLGINADTKPGNRLVSASIHSTVRNRSKYFGEFQKTEGRFRIFLKSAQNEAGGELYINYSKRFKELTGVDCPFRFGDVLQFPGYNLNTLRITDITLKRLIRILELLKEVKVVLTNIRIQTHIISLEQKEGYPFTIDRKSVKKLLLTLLQKRRLNILKLEVLENGIVQNIDVITVPEITSVGDKYVSEVLEKTMQEFKEQNKSFPSGHQLKKERLVVEKSTPQIEENSPCKQEQSQDVLMVEEEPEEQVPTCQPTDSLLHKTFSSVERLQLYNKYGKKGASPYSILSQKTIHTLVESAKQKRIGKLVHKRKPKKTVKIEIPKEVEETGSTSIDDSTSSPTKSVQSMINDSTTTKRPYSQNVRLMDNVDRVSLQHKAYLRSRFSQRERDMLLLIRACSFFLNPISRFWPHPKVMRNLMHEFVPESRTKTTYSLMASGIRELKDRQDQHQYVVKTLASFTELLDLRNRLVVMNLSQMQISKEGGDLKPKDIFFIDAFRTAYKLLFKESDDCPSIHTSDQEFKNHFINNKLHFVQVAPDDKSSFVPKRSQAPKNIEDIRESVAFNAVMAALLSENINTKSFDGSKIQPEPSTSDDTGVYLSTEGIDFTNFLLEQIEAPILSETMENIRADGLITKNRIFGKEQFDTQSKGISITLGNENTIDQSPQKNIENQESSSSYNTRKTVRLTQHYQHYFESSFHSNLKKNVLDTATKFIGNKSTRKNDFGEFENPGEFIILANQTSDSRPLNIDMTIPKSFDALFKLNKSSVISNEETTSHYKINATKQLRYLEDSELCIERLKIRPTTLSDSLLHTIRGMPQFEDLLPFQKFITPEKMALLEDPAFYNNPEQITGKFSKKIQKMFELIDQSGSLGIYEDDLKISINCKNVDEFNALLNPLIKETLIFSCGTDKRSYVSTRNGFAWLLKNKDGSGFVAKPWLFPSGEINRNILRWMLEGIFWHIYANPCISLDDLTARFVYVLQPVLMFELIEMLEKLGCCKIITKNVLSLRKSSPFSGIRTPQKIQFIQPNPKGMERLVLFKNSISN